jgi:ATP-binding cassette subfamily B protein
MKPRAAFSRAWRFLSFKPIAKWTALAAAVGTGVLYVVLLLVLGLFADLLVTRGQLPPYAGLTATERARFLRPWNDLDEERRRQLLRDLGLSENVTPTDEQKYHAIVYGLLEERVGPDAANLYRDQLSPDAPENSSLGVLSLIVRLVDQPIVQHSLSWLARWNPWMWRSGEALPYLSGLLMLAIFLALLRTTLLIVMHYAAALAAIEAATRMRRAVYHHTFRLGALAIRALGPGEAASNFTRFVESVHDGLYTWLTVYLRHPVQFGLLLAFALFIDFWLTTAFLIFALLVWLIGGQVATHFRNQGEEATRESASRLALLQESLMMMRLVKCYLMELFNQARVERQLKLYSRSLLDRQRDEAIYRPLVLFLGVVAAVVLLCVAGILVLDGRLGLAGAIVLVTALVSLYWPLIDWLEHRRFIRRAREAATILFGFLDRPPEVGQVVGAEMLPPLSDRLEFEDVTLKEPGTSRVLLRGVSLKVPAGQRIAIVGPDELEKHALVYLVPRFLDPSSGEIRIDKHNLRWVTFDSLRKQIAVVLQHNLVFNDTVANNIGCGDKAFTLPQIIEAAKVAHAHHFIQKLPKGYDTAVGEMGHALNTGERFRIALARAILREPALLIIEEPPAGTLDEDTRSLLDDTFTRMLPGRTAIFLPHRISTLGLCNKVYLLHKGKIEASGTHRELLEQHELYRHLHYLEYNIFATQL